MKESAIQQACFMWFQNTYGLNHHNPKMLMFSVPNEGKSAIEQMRKKAMGMKAGVSDTIIILPNKVIFCEFKDDKGVQSPFQKQFELDVTALGHEYWVIRSLDLFRININNAL